MINCPEDSPQNASFRAQLRRKCIAQRQNMAPQAYARANAAIDACLQGLLLPRAPAVIAFCWPIRAEFDARPLIHRLLDLGWTACLPVVVAAHAPMVFRTWRPDEAMAQDIHGIPIPSGGVSCCPDVLLLPLVAFDARGYRLGYGGGYFDRTLAALNPRPLTIGVGYEVGRVDTIRPGPHDVALDLNVTEGGVSIPSR